MSRYLTNQDLGFKKRSRYAVKANHSTTVVKAKLIGPTFPSRETTPNGWVFLLLLLNPDC